MAVRGGFAVGVLQPSTRVASHNMAVKPAVGVRHVDIDQP